MLYSAVVLIFIVGETFAQLPSRCMAPPQMQFRAMKLDHQKNRLSLFSVVYDKPNRRIAYVEEYSVFSKKREYHSFIYLYNENVVYDMNLSTKRCTKKLIDQPFHEIAIPQNATFFSEMTIGGPGEELFGQAWSDVFDDRLSWIGVFSLKNCFPIRDHRFVGTTTREGSSNYFYDVVAGIENPDVFIPPPECQT